MFHLKYILYYILNIPLHAPTGNTSLFSPTINISSILWKIRVYVSSKYILYYILNIPLLAPIGNTSLFSPTINIS